MPISNVLSGTLSDFVVSTTSSTVFWGTGVVVVVTESSFLQPNRTAKDRQTNRYFMINDVLNLTELLPGALQVKCLLIMKLPIAGFYAINLMGLRY